MKKKEIAVGDKTVTVTSENQQYFEGNIVVTDPCYFMPEEVWDALCEKVWFPEGITDPLSEGGTIYYDGATILYSSTAHGDGGYRVNEAHSGNDEFGVDSGTMCVITQKHFKLISDEVLAKGLYATVEEFSGDVYFEDGNFRGDLTAITDGSDGDDEEDDEHIDWLEEDDDEDISWDYDRDQEDNY